MDQIRTHVAGLDVHRDTVTACARLPGPDGNPTPSKRRFKATTAGLGDLATWLASQGVRTVAMEATGVYWKPVYYALEGLFQEVWLCNAHHVKNVPGRKTDMADAEWLADVVAHGMVRPSLVPPPPIRALRNLSRYRKSIVDMRVSETQRLEKVLQDAGIKLSSVASKILTVSGRSMIEALIAGERDPKSLAELSMRKMRNKKAELEEALVGRFEAHHAILAGQILGHIDHLDAEIHRLTATIVELLSPYRAAVELCLTIPGVGALTAEAIVAETGADMSRFPTARHLAAWAGVAPAANESAGKRRAAGTRHGAPWLRRHLIEAAKAASRTRNTYLAAQYRQIAARRGPNKAAVAVANTLCVAIWHMLTNGTPYEDLGADYFQRRRNPDRETRRLVMRLEALGHHVELSGAATPAAT
jgi:transposase